MSNLSIGQDTQACPLQLLNSVFQVQITVYSWWDTLKQFKFVACRAVWIVCWRLLGKRICLLKELQVSQQQSLCRDTRYTSSTVNTCKTTWVLLNFHSCSCREVRLFPFISYITISEHWKPIEDVSFQLNKVELKHTELTFSLWIFRLSQRPANLVFDGKRTIMTLINIIKSHYDDGTQELFPGLKHLLPLSHPTEKT